MKAVLKSLEGKYYGTIVEIVDGDYQGHEVTIWISLGNGRLDPSIRELEKYGVTQEQFDKNEQLGTYPMETPDYCDGKPGEPILAQDALHIFDSHFEGRVAYEVALELVKVFDRIKDKRP